MASVSIPETTAPTHYVELADSEGRLVLLPRATVDAMLAAGRTSISMTISLTAEPPQPWLTVAEAARLLMTDVDDLTFEAAQTRVSRACSANEIVSVGIGAKRRIDPISLGAWRLSQREKNLAKYDE